ncbi:MAG: glutamate--tRNA ligase, partial [Candidatus Omnitrophica bacterium]|nr:glutamate--tRNA ligase [Candidatus Omnitrophota bacterium]
LRIEDTDKVRSKGEYLNEILESLRWLGLNWDGEPYFQSKRIDLYNTYAKKLLSARFAYEKEGAIYFKMPPMKLKINDIVHGDIEFDTSLIKDQVIIKSDGMPTYNFACVIDDADMKITHIIRGDDHISNTPKQVVIYNALKIDLPKFCHIPLILGLDRSRLSKRHGATSIRDYRQEGFLPQGLVNYLCLLGWSPGTGEEIMPIQEVIKKFSLKNISKTATVFDINKLQWMNSEYIRAMDTTKLTDLIIDALRKENLLPEKFDRIWVQDIVKLFKERIKTIYDFVDLTSYFFKDDFEYDADGVKRFFTSDLKDIFLKLIDRLKALDNFDAASIEEAVRSLADELGVKAAKLIHPTRLALTGRTGGAGLFETACLLGKDKALKRLDAVLSKFFN